MIHVVTADIYKRLLGISWIAFNKCLPLFYGKHKTESTNLPSMKAQLCVRMKAKWFSAFAPGLKTGIYVFYAAPV